MNYNSDNTQFNPNANYNNDPNYQQGQTQGFDPNQTRAINNQQPAGNAGQGGPMNVQMDPQQYQQYQQWMQQYQQGNYNQVPHDHLHRHWNQYAQQANPQQVQQAATQGYQQVPAQQRPGIANSLLSFFQQHGLSPQAAGVQNTNPQNMTPEDMGRMTQYAQQQKPDALQQLFQPGGTFSNPLIGMALAGALAYGVSQVGKNR